MTSIGSHVDHTTPHGIEAKIKSDSVFQLGKLIWKKDDYHCHTYLV